MKRKAEISATAQESTKKRVQKDLGAKGANGRFRAGLFDEAELERHRSSYATSTPYRHAVIANLVNDTLLRAVRSEIQANVSFTLKETDIYKIHQSGDLANLDGLDDAALAKLPSLLQLRDALYSPDFRDYISAVTGCGPLSGKKTDMAVNVYTPGCYLLCHDDVIGSRRVSYILYLVDPDMPWKPEWGGALRLFPVSESSPNEDGETARLVSPDAIKTIPPAWNQLSFFTVQPGSSFHDVEEVYHADSAEQLAKDGGRVRIAISGWFHIPQPGEPGFVVGEEEEKARNSGLAQLQGNPDQYDRPNPSPVPVTDARAESDEALGLDAADFGFLLKYMNVEYLMPDTLEDMARHFDQNSTITLSEILGAQFATRLRDYVEKQEKTKLPQDDSAAIEKMGPWKVARPPHKHRFLYMESQESGDKSPVKELLDELVPSRQFRTWLQMVTRTVIESHDLLARRFRRGMDYTLATGYEGKPRLEMNIGFTPTDGWGGEGEEAGCLFVENGEGVNDENVNGKEEHNMEKPDEKEHKKGEKMGSDENTYNSKTNGKESSGSKVALSKPTAKLNVVTEEHTKPNGKGEGGAELEDDMEELEENDNGGHEIYMAGDDEADEDAAIYRSGADDDNILFHQTAAWNRMTLVLRDSGTLRFVKYVGRSAKGDRWDICGTFEVEEQDEESADEQAGLEVESEEEEFRGFSSSPSHHVSDS